MHYDYVHPRPALGGFAEDALAVAIKQVGGKKSRWAAWNTFRFGSPLLTDAQIDQRVAKHDVTPAFNAVFEGMKGLVNPFTILTAPKDMKLEEKQAVHDDLWKKWKEAWSTLMPTSPKPTRDEAKAEAIADAKAKAKEKALASVLAMRSRGAADAKTGRYNPPPASPPPDFNTANYQAGWKSVAPLPSGVADVALSIASEGTKKQSSFPLVPVLLAVAAGAFFIMRKKG